MSPRSKEPSPIKQHYGGAHTFTVYPEQFSDEEEQHSPPAPPSSPDRDALGDSESESESEGTSSGSGSELSEEDTPPAELRQSLNKGPAKE